MARSSMKCHGTAATMRWVYTLVGLAFFAMQIPAARAGELSVLVNGVAKHVNPPAGTNFNERNWGTGLQYDFDRTQDNWVPFVSASGFKDSFKHMSYYAGGGALRRFDLAPKLDNLHVDLGAVAFFMTREDFHDNKPFFGALPVASIGTDHFAVNITYIPKVHPKLVPLWFFQLKIPVATF